MTNQTQMTVKIDGTDRSNTYAWAAAAIVFIAWAGSGIVISKYFESWNTRGTFGDMFGAVNALFSGLAFAILIVTLYLQKIELREQRKTLIQTREELKGQKGQLELQNFENTFFKLLSFYHEYVNSLHFYEFSEKGKELFPLLFEKLKFNYLNCRDTESINDKTLPDMLYRNFFKKYDQHLMVWFNNIKNVLASIDESKINNRKRYLLILKTQLSKYELSLLFYYLYSYNDKEALRLSKDHDLLDSFELISENLAQILNRFYDDKLDNSNNSNRGQPPILKGQ